MFLPDVPAHIVQRGNNRDACFFTDDDYLYYLEVLGQGLRHYGVKLRAYCLMTPKDEVGISRVMQHLDRLYEETGSAINFL